MRAVVQRVRQASVSIAHQTVGQIEQGLLILLGIHTSDTSTQVRWLAEKIVGLRIFEDAAGKMNLSLADVHGAMLIVSQFTVYGNCEKGRRPSFNEAAPPTIAEPLYQEFIQAVQAMNIPIATGQFGADMQVHLTNDGPVTLILDTPS